jgi:hypothetical protein
MLLACSFVEFRYDARKKLLPEKVFLVQAVLAPQWVRAESEVL